MSLNDALEEYTALTAQLRNLENQSVGKKAYALRLILTDFVDDILTSMGEVGNNTDPIEREHIRLNFRKRNIRHLPEELQEQARTHIENTLQMAGGGRKRKPIVKKSSVRKPNLKRLSKKKTSKKH